MRKLLLSIVVGLMFSGCNYYTNEIITPDRYEDVPGLEGQYEIAIQDQEFNMTVHRLSFKRQSQGTYITDEGRVLHTGRINGDFYMEEKSPDTPGQGLSKVETIGNVVYISAILFDRSKLEEEGIPYKVIKDEPRLQYLSKFVPQEDGDQTYLVVNNSGVDVQKLMKTTVSATISIRLNKK